MVAITSFSFARPVGIEAMECKESNAANAKRLLASNETIRSVWSVPPLPVIQKCECYPNNVKYKLIGWWLLGVVKNRRAAIVVMNDWMILVGGLEGLTMWWIAFDGSDDDESGLPIGGVAKVEDTYCID
eukprot:CAMPEP_0202482360 /NCGR_PEP_ID=MMETSP1361-20130828/1775_1 /ASSEMBLY_ACC=CAM_ASM_000849 /TAXON_ID=210615 /ORGANISM="Staurosira complex sp., Strain CCMP2646" /LENGTH=128 /DNA_ID=CAMNT_0049110209 /DNA_START=653 /DNA_END=1040 /DNA_ORIENTATION=-